VTNHRTRLCPLVWLLPLALSGGCVVPQPSGKGKVLHLYEPQTKTPYYLYLPEDYVKTNGKRTDGKKWPLVMTFHGMKPFDTYDRQIHEWEEESDRYGFITCAPFMRHASVLDEYPVNRESPQFKQDVQHILAVMSDVFRRTEADPTRVLSTGWSQGGYMAHYMVNRYPHLFACLSVKQCNFSSEIMNPAQARLYHRKPVAVYYTQNDFGICRKESAEAVVWYRQQGFANLASGVIDTYGHERTPQVAADFFAKHCGVPPKTPPTQLAKIRVSEIPPDALAQVTLERPLPRVAPIRPAPTPPVNYTDTTLRQPGGYASDLVFEPRTAPRRTTGVASAERLPPDVARSSNLLDGERRVAQARDATRVGTDWPPPAPLPAAPAHAPTVAETLVLPEHKLPTYRLPSRPESAPTPPRLLPPAPRRSAAREASAKVQISTTIGISPLLVSFQVLLHPEHLRNADILWTDNGEPIASGPDGRHILTIPGDHRLEVLAITATGLELRGAQVVRVLPRRQRDPIGQQTALDLGP